MPLELVSPPGAGRSSRTPSSPSEEPAALPTAPLVRSLSVRPRRVPRSSARSGGRWSSSRAAPPRRDGGCAAYSSRRRSPIPMPRWGLHATPGRPACRSHRGTGLRRARTLGASTGRHIRSTALGEPAPTAAESPSRRPAANVDPGGQNSRALPIGAPAGTPRASSDPPLRRRRLSRRRAGRGRPPNGNAGADDRPAARERALAGAARLTGGSGTQRRSLRAACTEARRTPLRAGRRPGGARIWRSIWSREVRRISRLRAAAPHRLYGCRVAHFAEPPGARGATPVAARRIVHRGDRQGRAWLNGLGNRTSQLGLQTWGFAGLS